MMNKMVTRGVQVSVESFYLEHDSRPDENKFTFAYRIQLKNLSEETVQLISRHWIITDSVGKVQHVKGPGVVGEQPVLKPGQEYEYTSGSRLESPMGTMEGTYQMVNDDGLEFEIKIPMFTLAVPGTLN